MGRVNKRSSSQTSYAVEFPAAGGARAAPHPRSMEMLFRFLPKKRCETGIEIESKTEIEIELRGPFVSISLSVCPRYRRNGQTDHDGKRRGRRAYWAPFGKSEAKPESGLDREEIKDEERDLNYEGYIDKGKIHMYGIESNSREAPPTLYIQTKAPFGVAYVSGEGSTV
ncbi:hypothetical protein EVAR_54606_1 [Eumeta japonica]|uniref:Uncharacterized protein n=1 Tax=Eumeta variegata TaxID=151549 RepID=A0A4C1YQL0_EUMVA|nr:hypothetical protein EVAR_54606_1 [Eumeta japonica]